MASTYTSLLKFNKPALGDAGWGTSVNSGFTDMVEQALTGALSAAVTAGGTTTLSAIANGTSSDARNQFIVATGSLGSSDTATLQFPAGTGSNYKLYSVKNSSGGTLVLSTSGGTTVSVPNGKSIIVRVTSGGVEETTTFLLAASGGTGFTSYTVGDLLYANTTTTLAKLADVVTGNVLRSGGVGVAPAWGKVDLTTDVTGILPPANGGAVPSGTIMLFVQTAAPTGWTKSTTHDNKALRVVSGTASSGGSVAFTTAFASGLNAGGTTLTTAQMPGHTHTGSTSNPGNFITGSVAADIGSSAGIFVGPTGAFSVAGGTSEFAAFGGNTGFRYTQFSISAGSHTHTFTSDSTGGGTSHNHTLPSFDVQYVDVIIATKD